MFFNSQWRSEGGREGQTAPGRQSGGGGKNGGNNGKYWSDKGTLGI